MEAKKELDTAYALLSKIFVNENNVELMAAAKAAIRRAYDSLKDSEVKDNG
ncbi:MAG: hypothetical protein II630_01680 [Bacteroidales bacterium]|nr:hypothetical protein [Bacteroidales bacterium]